MSRLNHTKSPRSTRGAQLLLSGATLALLGACDRGGEAETAVREASIVLESGAEADVLSGGSGSDSAVDFRVRRLEEALEKLSPHLDDSDSAYQSAAAVLSAVAENGLAIEEEAKLIGQMRELDNRRTVLRGVLAQWWKHHAVAEASATFDPQDSVEDLNRMTSMLEVDVEQIGQTKGVLDRKINELESQIAEAATQSTTERAEAARLQLESSRAAPAERPALAERVREHSRRADSYEFQAQRLETRAGQIRPDAEEKGRHMERLRKQLGLLEDSRQQIAEQQRASADDAAAARRAAAQTEADLLRMSGDLNDFVENDLADLATVGERHLRSAVAVAGKSGASAKDSANLAKASALHRLGDLHTTMSVAHESLADLFAHLGTLSLDNASRFAELGVVRAASADEARQAATDAYSRAASALRSVRVRSEAKDALNELADRLEGIEPESGDEFGADEFGGDEFDDAAAGMGEVEIDRSLIDDEAGEDAPDPDGAP